MTGLSCLESQICLRNTAYLFSESLISPEKTTDISNSGCLGVGGDNRDLRCIADETEITGWDNHMRILPVLAVLLLPIFVSIFHRKIPGNRLTAWLIPEILPDQKHPKAKLRRVGTAYVVFGLWLVAIPLALTYLFPDPQIDKYPWVCGLLYFVIPLLAVLSLIVGIYYVILGVFGRGEYIRPTLESMYYAPKRNQDTYVRKLKTYTIINLASLFLLITIVPVEAYLNVTARYYVVLPNVALLITFIMTIWRIRAYIVKVATSLDFHATGFLVSTLFHPLAIFMVWIHSFFLIKEFDRRRESRQ
jgi:hypothetical protein